MNLFHYPFRLCLAALLILSACGKVAEPVADETVESTFEINLAQTDTKAFSDGLSATSLSVFVYSVRDGAYKYLPSVSLPSESISGSTRVTLRLVKGESYHIVFWAQHPEGPYTLDPASGTMTVSPSGPANAELRDAFYKTWDGKVTAGFNERVELRRPFAQINVLTTAADWQAAVDNEIAFSGSSMKVTAPTVLDLHTGAASVPVEYDLTVAAMTVDNPNVPGYEENYKYIAMNYILAGDRATGKVAFSVYRGDATEPLYSYEVRNVPYQRNYRTNIIGDIFSVNGVFNIVIVPEYETPQNTVNL
jgi:hypothetical protein